MPTTVAINPAWSLQSLNNAANGRVHDFSFLQQANTQPMQLPRAGVIPSVATQGNFSAVDLFTTQSNTPGMSVQLYPGSAVVAASGRGPYIASSSAFQTLTVATANGTNPRLDLVYLQVLDQVAGDASTATQLGIVTGTPAATPVLPSLPATGVCIPLASVLVPANATSIVNANITDLRKSAAIGRGPRFLLGGDAVTDQAYCYGEIRQRIVPLYPSNGTYGIFTDYWGFDSQWHGMNGPYPFLGTWQNGLSDIAAGTTETLLYTVTVPDPGYAYYLKANVNIEYNGVASGNATVAVVHQNNLSGNSFGSVVGIGSSSGFQSLDGSFWLNTIPGTSQPVIQRWTGATVLALGMIVLGSGTATCKNPANFGSTNFSVEMVPA